MTTPPFVRVVLVPLGVPVLAVLASSVEEVPSFVSLFASPEPIEPITPFEVRVFVFIRRFVAPPDTPFPISAAPAAAAAEAAEGFDTEEVDDDVEEEEEDEEEDQEERI